MNMKVSLAIGLLLCQSIVFADVCPDPAKLGPVGRKNLPDGFKMVGDSASCVLDGQVIFNHASIVGDSEGIVSCEYTVVSPSPGSESCSFVLDTVSPVTIKANTGWVIAGGENEPNRPGEKRPKRTDCIPLDPLSPPKYNANKCQFD